MTKKIKISTVLKTQNKEVRTLRTELDVVSETVKNLNELNSNLSKKLEAHANDLNYKSDSRQEEEDQMLSFLEKLDKIKSKVSDNEKKDSLSTQCFYKNRFIISKLNFCSTLE